MDRIAIVDTTLRDGQQSLWAGRMRAEAMLPAIGDIDAAGYAGAEFAVPTAQFPRAVRDLKENPWDWLRLGSAAARRTQLRLHGGIHTRLAKVPMCVRELFFDRVAELGITVTRTSDPWNDFSKLQDTVTVMGRHGIETVANLIYTVSPRHTREYYAQKTREAAAISPYRICFKDVGGLMTPEAARELVPVVLENAGSVPVELHVHCNNGLGPYVVLVAVDAGIRTVHTAIPPLANGSSQPSVFTVVRNLRERGWTVDLDTAPLERASAHLFRVAEVEGLPVGRPAEYDETLYSHQVPGGMISNLRYQLAQLGKEDLLAEALREVARVRQDFGYPIMVTPLAQFVGTQAVVNVIAGTRYGTVTDETILYALGNWGSEARDVMDADLRADLLDRPRAKELAASSAESGEEPSLSEVRQRFGAGVSDEELIVRVFLGASSSSNEFPPYGSPARTYEEYEAAHSPLVRLLRTVTANPSVRHFAWKQDGFGVTVDR